MKVNQPREVSAAITRLRAEIEQLPFRGGRRKGVCEDLKRRSAMALAESGMALKDFAAAISVSVSAMNSWRNQFGNDPAGASMKNKSRQGFKKVAITSESQETGGIRIEGPNGLKITGLSADEVARLWRALC